MTAQDDGWRARWKRVTPGPRLRALAGALIDTVLPPLTLDAGRRDAGPATGGGLGSKAWSAITFLEEPVCDGCGAAFAYDGGALADDRCFACIQAPHRFGRARAACVYDDASRALVLAFKHGDRTEHAPLFTRWLSRAAAPLLRDADAVVPVPLHPARLVSRRYNQAAEIARPLARLTRLDYLPDSLIRQKNATQGGKSASGRRREVQGAFAVPEARRPRVKGRHILLIDDVLTTGATADACARALLAAGARAVDVAVVARVARAREVTI